MKRWVVAQKKADFNAIANKYGVSPYIARIIRNRNVIEDKDINIFLNGTRDDMHDPSLLKDIDKAAKRIISGISDGEKIRVIGDYDADGICSSFILKRAFSLMGADVDVVLPDRVLDGYGLNKSLIERALNDGVSLIVTCDNGIAATDEIAYAKSLGISVVVTDHHEVPYIFENNQKKYILPDAVAVVDPKREDCNYPFEGICGAMVAYKLVVYITSQECYKSYADKIDSDVMDELLVFAALATVGDIMEILDENRVAVKEAIRLIKGCVNKGLKALIEVNGLDAGNISTGNISFVIVPCMNSSGRIDTAMRVLSLFEEPDYEHAVVLAEEIKELNAQRKNIMLMYIETAIQMAESEEYASDKVLVLYLPECHESLAGIVAGKIRERVYKPVIIITDAASGVKGSGRSIEDYNLFEELSAVKDVVIKFGGHKMAAGMNLERERIEELRRRLNANTTLTDEQLIEKFVIDIPLPVGYADLDLAHELEKIGPFGVGNPAPLFAQKDIVFSDLKLQGPNSNVLKMKLHGVDSKNNQVKREGILFDNAQEAYEKLSSRNTISILYQVKINSYRNTENVQLVIKDFF